MFSFVALSILGIMEFSMKGTFPGPKPSRIMPRAPLSMTRSMISASKPGKSFRREMFASNFGWYLRMRLRRFLRHSKTQGGRPSSPR